MSSFRQSDLRRYAKRTFRASNVVVSLYGNIDEDELVDGLCPDHRIPLELVEEENYFFRLSRYGDTLLSLIDSGELRERILREIEAFVGTADQHDDMTMILIKITQVVVEEVAV